jgi:hypothetical protein
MRRGGGGVLRWVMKLGNGMWPREVESREDGQGELESMLQLRATDLRSQYRIHPRGALGSFTFCNGNGAAQQCEKHGRSRHYRNYEEKAMLYLELGFGKSVTVGDRTSTITPALVGPLGDVCSRRAAQAWRGLARVGRVLALARDLAALDPGTTCAI